MNISNLNLPQQDVTVSAEPEFSSDVALGEPSCDTLQPSHISVFADKVCPNQYCGEDERVISMDIVFVVNIYNTKTFMTESYNVVRRIGVDKLSLAQSAMCTTPMAVLENKDTGVADDVTAAAIKKLKVLAGI